MNIHWKNFRKDKYYLLKYFAVSLLVLTCLLILQWNLIDKSVFFQLDLNISSLWLLPIGLIIGVKAPVLIHNCVHGNLKTPFLNQLAGELAGMYVWLGMAAFEINHRMHHAHADSDLDPHNPSGRKFIPFFFANNFGGTRPVLQMFLKYHGDSNYNRRLFKLILFMHFIGVPMRMSFWLLLLGPSLFLCFFMPSYLFHMFVFAHINYVTHQTGPSGKVEVYDMNSNIYYKFVNYFGNGVYFHKSHHERPSHYNPQLHLKYSRFLY